MTFVQSECQPIFLEPFEDPSDDVLVFFVSLREYDDVIKVTISIGDTFQDFIGEALEAGRGVPDSKGKSEELIKSPGSIDTNFLLIFLPNRNKMEGFGHINLAEHLAGLDMAGEGVDVGELVSFLDGGVV